jgi:hypothetical protein
VRRFCVAALACAALLAALSPGRALGAIISGTVDSVDGTQTFSFSGTAGGGTGSALLNVKVTSTGGTTTVVASLWNTSPTTYLDVNSQTQANLAAVTGFGFDVTPDLTFSSYSIVARQWNGSSFSSVLLGDTNPTGNVWNLIDDGGTGNISVDLYANNGSGIASGLYNPLLAGNPAIGSTNPFFTEATLTITFASPDVAVNWAYSDQPGIEGNGSYVSLFVRMQRVGDGSSLKLEPEPPPEETLLVHAPEPASLAIWVLGAGALAIIYRCRKRPAAA